MGWKGPTGFGSRATAAEVVANWNGTGKTVIITGATGGLGGEAARVLASKGAEVVLAVRDVAKGQALAKVGCHGCSGWLLFHSSASHCLYCYSQLQWQLLCC